MTAFAAIVRWEVAYYLRRISTWVYFGIFFLIALFFILIAAGVWDELDVLTGSGGKILANSPFFLASLLPIIALLGVSITAALAGNALYRDYDVVMDPLVYTTPVSKPAFLAGRFVGSLIVNAIVLMGIGCGAAVATVMPGVKPDRIGPFSLAAYAAPYVTHVFPNLLLTAAIFFALVSLTRKMLPNYVGGAVLLIGYLLATSALGDFRNKGIAGVLDPFGMRPQSIITEYWTIAEKNHRLVPMSGLLLTNRLLWCAVALTVLVVAFVRFRFAHAADEQSRVPAPTPLPGPILLGQPVRLSAIPVASREFGARAHAVEFASIFRGAFRTIVVSRYFGVIVAAGLLYLLLVAGQLGSIYGTPTWPVTHQMVDALAGSFTLFTLVITVFYAGELVWSERDARIAGIFDATPVGAPTVYLAKLAALCAVIAVLQLAMIVPGMIVQAYHGYYHFEVGLYVQALLGVQYIDLVLLAVLAFAIHVVVNHKYAGHFAIIVIAIGNGLLPQLGVEHNLLQFSSDSGTTYSDMNGWGPFLGPFFWWKAYWSAFTVLLLVAVQLFWVRGGETEARWRLALARRRFQGATRRAAIGGGVAFAMLGGFVFYNTNILNTFRTTKSERRLRVEYEQRYKRFESMPQPRIASITVAVDLYPERQSFAARGTYVLRNRTAVAIDTVQVMMIEDLTRRDITFDRPSTQVLADRERNFYLYRLERPLAPGDSMVLRFDLAVETRGFPNQITNTDIVANGTFLGNSLFMPGIGYAADEEIADEDRRKSQHLPPKPRMRPPTDSATWRNSYISHHADWVRFDATVSTDPRETAITSGYLDSTWMAGGRRFFHYQMATPIVNLWGIQSARYTVKRDEWRSSVPSGSGSAGQAVAIEIDYHAPHAYNVDGMIASVKASLDYYSANFGSYQHRIVRIVEFPRYASYAQSLPNTIPYSEAVGFIARLEDAQSIDYPYYVTAHEVAHQWWAHQLVGADAQGATMLSETLAQYSAMMVMEKRFGASNMRRFLEYELDNYLKGRSTERRREMPIELGENQPYIHYNKGSLVMYALRDYIGEAKVNGALRGMLNAHKFKGPPYPVSLELVDSLRAVTPDSLKYLITDLLETITLYEMKTDSIVVSDSTAGLYRVDLYGTTKKLRADSLGAEQEIAMSDLVDIGLFKQAPKGDTTVDKTGIPVYLAKQRLASGKQHIVLTTSERPIRGGIDPLHKLVDRKVDDNTVGVFDRTKAAPAAKSVKPSVRLDTARRPR